MTAFVSMIVDELCGIEPCGNQPVWGEGVAAFQEAGTTINDSMA
jgi:hypothetical protein